jgi:hypothetical protein
VQKSNAMTWLGWRTRADHIADQIEEAAAKARAVSA